MKLEESGHVISIRGLHVMAVGSVPEFHRSIGDNTDDAVATIVEAIRGRTGGQDQPGTERNHEESGGPGAARNRQRDGQAAQPLTEVSAGKMALVQARVP